MSDDRITEYLRARGQGSVPVDFAGSVLDAVAGSPAHRPSRFAAMLPATLVAAGVLAIVGVAIMVGPDRIGFLPQPSIGGDGRSPTSSQQPTNSPAPSGSASATYIDRDGLAFTVLESSEADALMADPDSCTNPGGYVVSYPDSWYTNTAIGAVPACTWFSPEFFEADAGEEVPDEIAIILGVFEGSIGQIPEQPRVFSEQLGLHGLSLSRFEDQVSSDPAEFTYGYAAWLDDDYLGRKLTGLTGTSRGGEYELNRAVLDRMVASLVLLESNAIATEPHADADALFADVDTCTNPVDGYTVTYPNSWYTNTQIGEVPACSWFSPGWFEVADPLLVPDEIWMTIGTIDSALGYTSLTDVVSNESVEIGDLTGRRVEFNDDPVGQPERRGYHFVIELGPSAATGPTFVASTGNDTAPDYELAKAVLDRIMASLVFTD